ncbi:MAG: ExtraCellular Mutant; Ecm15p, partial [uncultured Solirubrobacterales bacterium]
GHRRLHGNRPRTVRGERVVLPGRDPPPARGSGSRRLSHARHGHLARGRGRRHPRRGGGDACRAARARPPACLHDPQARRAPRQAGPDPGRQGALGGGAAARRSL